MLQRVAQTGVKDAPQKHEPEFSTFVQAQLHQIGEASRPVDFTENAYLRMKSNHRGIAI